MKTLRRRALLLTLLAAAAGCGSGESRLTARFVQLLHGRMPTAGIRVVGPLEVEVRGPKGTVHQDLHGLWQQCQRAPDTCDANLNRVAGLLAGNQVLASLQLGRAQVRPVIKDRRWVETTLRNLRSAPGGKVPGVGLVARPLVGDLWVVCAFDLPDGIRMMNPDDLQSLGLTQEQVEAIAIANLRAMAAPPHDAVETGARVFYESAGDGYESSRLLLHEHWGKIASELHGELLVSVPTNGTIFFTGSEEGAAALGRFRELTRQVTREGPHPVSETILRYLPNGWAVVAGSSGTG